MQKLQALNLYFAVLQAAVPRGGCLLFSVQRLLNRGAHDLIQIAGSEFRRFQGFALQNACTPALAAVPPSAGSCVQQAINCTFYIAKALKTTELSQFRGFSF